MSAQFLEEVKRVLDEALRLSPEERHAFVASSCGEDEELRREVESLLTQADAEQVWREGPIVSLHAEGSGAKGLEAGQRLGPYRILGPLGKGGMGSVALAVRQDDFEKKVAIKVLRPLWESSDLLRRFEDERQILAELEHPNIAQILDAGTAPDGCPYFVMEKVEGKPIDRYCQEAGLSVRERLKLVLQVCSALDCAHRNLVAHRDLKPANILVTEDGAPKLLDFGIAKRLGPEPLDATDIERRPMTLQYASPEQITGRRVNALTDIYSLGVILYELLTNVRPFSQAEGSNFALARAITEDDPAPPSVRVAKDREARSRLAGDLDSIVLKAISKEPGRRYGSVEQLADDIRSFLQGRPVVARDGTWPYRFGKFARRNRLSLSAAAAAVLLVAAFAGTVTRAVAERERAQLEEMRAADERERSEKVLLFMKNIFWGSVQQREVGGEVSALELLEQGERDVETEFDDRHLQAEFLATIGEVYVNLGHVERAGRPWRRAEELLRQAYPEGHPALAKAINNHASSCYRTGDYDNAERLYREALAMKLELSATEAGEIDVAKSKANMATILMTRGAYEEAEVLYREALASRRASYPAGHSAIATSLRSLGVLYYQWGRMDLAEPPLTEALAIRQEAYGAEHPRVASALTSLGRVHLAQGRHEAAEELFSRSLSIRRSQFGARHPHVAANELDLATLFLATGEIDRGRERLTSALAILRATKPEGSWEVAEAESVLGAYLTRAGEYRQAESLLLKSLTTLRAVRGDRSAYTRGARARLERLYAAWGRPEQAARSSGQAS